LIYRCWYYK